MIEINLLPGARKKSRSSGGSSLDVRALVASLGERFKDPWMGIAVGGVAVGLLAIGGMWVQGREEPRCSSKGVAVQDSTRFEGVVRTTHSPSAARLDPAADVDHRRDRRRSIWPHVMDEVSRALPTYGCARVNQRTPRRR
jgi:hypothetical protein